MLHKQLFIGPTGLFLDPFCEFFQHDVKALETLVRTIAHPGMRMAEIGSWIGGSTSVLGKVAKEYGGVVFAIDHWEGSLGVRAHQEIVNEFNMHTLFLEHMQARELLGVVKDVKMDSLMAVKSFLPESLDLVFIDADHRYSAVWEDIEAWLPKVKPGGVLCGHDCEGYFSEYSEAEQVYIIEHDEEDYVVQVVAGSEKGYHCGVIEALFDWFEDKYKRMPDSSIWYLKRE